MVAYDKDKLEQIALDAIKSNELVFIDDLRAYLPCAMSTFYNLKLQNRNSIQCELIKNSTKRNVKKITPKKTKYTGVMGYVYIIKCGDFDYYKIGISKADYKNRLSNLQSGNPFKLNMIKVFHCLNFSEIESYIHSYIKLKNISGEWFSLSKLELDEVVRKIEKNVKVNPTLF